jgi:hypothetical protein
MEIEAQAPGKLGQFARRLGRISAITRFFGGAAVFLGVAVMMYGCSRLDHRTDDAVGFGSLGLGMARWARSSGASARSTAPSPSRWGASRASTTASTRR